MHSKIKKRTHRRKTAKSKKPVKSVADLPLCNLYIFSIVVLEALLVVMIFLSSPKSNPVIIKSKDNKIQANACNNNEETMDLATVARNEAQIETPAVEENLVTTKISDVIETKNIESDVIEKIAKDDISNADDARETLVGTKESVAEETTVETKDSVIEEIAESNESEVEELTTKTKEPKAKETVAKVEEHVAEETVIGTEETAVDEKTAETKDTVVEETAVGAEEPVVDEIAVKEPVASETVVEENVVGSEESISGVKNVERSGEVELLANIMYAEEGVFIESDPANAEKAHKLCGSTVLHRMEVNFGGASTMQEVLYAKGQYASATKRRIEKGQDIPECVYKWAEELLASGPIGPSNLVYQAQFKQGEVFEKVGNQYFCLSDVYEPEEMQFVPEPETIVESDSVEPQEDTIVEDSFVIEEYDI